MAEYAEYIDRKLLVPDVDFDGDGNEDAVSIAQIKSIRALDAIKEGIEEAKHLDNVAVLKPVILCRNCDNLDKDISYCKELDKVIDNWSFYCANGVPKNK